MCSREERKERENKTLVVFVTVTTRKKKDQRNEMCKVINEMNRETVSLRLHCIVGWRRVAKQERKSERKGVVY